LRKEVALLMKRIVLVVTVGIVMATMLVLAGPSFAAHGNITFNAIPEEVAALKQATAKYQLLSNVVNEDGNIVDDDGNIYVAPDGGCVYNNNLKAGMGYHYVARKDVRRGTLTAGIGGDPLKPEVLLYAPDKATGELKLVGVEWMVRDADQKLGTENEFRPELFGEPFHGPMVGHEGWMPIHYDLHAWIWELNPSGDFADFNPNVSCESPSS
jgi:hypothetical protein